MTWMPRRVLSAGVSRSCGTPSTTMRPPGSRRLDAGDDLDQRRLAGAVLADQAMHLAGLDVQVDLAQRMHAAEDLGDVLELEEAGHRRDSSATGLISDERRSGELDRRGSRTATSDPRRSSSLPARAEASSADQRPCSIRPSTVSLLMMHDLVDLDLLVLDVDRRLAEAGDLDAVDDRRAVEHQLADRHHGVAGVGRVPQDSPRGWCRP